MERGSGTVTNDTAVKLPAAAAAAASVATDCVLRRNGRLTTIGTKTRKKNCNRFMNGARITVVERVRFFSPQKKLT